MKKIVKPLFVGVLTCLLAVEAGAAEDYAYYVNNVGKKIKVQDIRVKNEQGDLEIAISGGGAQNLRKADYKFAYVPKPQQVALLQQMLVQGSYDEVLKNVQVVLDRYKFLGWGGLLYYMKGEAELAKDQAEAALRSVEMGRRYARDEDLEFLELLQAKALLALDKTEELQQVMKKLKSSSLDQAAAFSFLAQGKILAGKGRANDAIIELMKTVLLFEPEAKVAAIHEEARKMLVELLKQKGDPSYKKFETK